MYLNVAYHIGAEGRMKMYITVLILSERVDVLLVVFAALSMLIVFVVLTLMVI